MAGYRISRTAGWLAAFFLSAAPVTALAMQAADDDTDDNDQAAQLAQDIGCVATYDVLMSASKGKASANLTLKAARDAALDAFRQDSDLPEAQVRADVAEADRMLPSMLHQTHQTLAAYKAGCDAAFMANPFADSDATPL